MPLLPGLYKVNFKTQLGEGIGIVNLEQGRLRGGDAVYAWVGGYEEPEGRFVAQLSIFRHTPGEAAASVFGVDDAKVRLSGAPDGPAFDVEGSTEAAPGMRFEATLTKVAD